MKVTGIVVEYNPFHQGHRLHLTKTREITQCDLLIAVMSPNFMQRGEPSIVSKETRTKWALENGIDLVVELPFIYVVENPDIFAFGALSILTDLGVESLVFGAESGPTADFLIKYANCDFASPRLDDLISEFIALGHNYAQAKNLALCKIHDYHLENPNDILGCSYLKIIQKHQLTMQPIVIKRQEMLDSENYPITSQIIRNKLRQSRDDKIENLSDYHLEDLHFLEDYFLILKYRLLTATPEQLYQIHLVDEGLQYLFLNQIKIATSLADFIDKCTSKRFSGARITRTIVHILNNTSKVEAAKILANKPPYIRILGANEVGRNYLSLIRKSCPTPIINRFEAKHFPLLLEELKSTGLYFINREEPFRSQEYVKERSLFPIQWK